MKHITTVVVLSVILLSGIVLAQVREEGLVRRLERGKEIIRPDEIVSFKSDIPFAQAMQSLSEISKKFTGKIIVDPNPPADKQIGINIQSMYWREAFEVILRTNGRWYKELNEYFQVIPMTQEIAGGVPQTIAQQPGAPAVAIIDSAMLAAKSREVRISAVFLEINKTKLAESGLNFSIFRGRNLNLGIEFSAADRVSSDILRADINPSSRRLSVDISAALQFFESNGFGEVIAQPQVTVRSGMLGRVQVGEDFSIKQRDFAGNLIDQFYSTGTILAVTPRVYHFNGIDFVDISVDVERSSVLPDPVTIRVNKTQATSNLLLINGEENYVGGLFLNEERGSREGVPLLKDLPWWVFGLRYVFGYDKKETIRKELIVLLKADILPVLQDRAAKDKDSLDVLQKTLEEGREELRKKLQQNKK